MVRKFDLVIFGVGTICITFGTVGAGVGFVHNAIFLGVIGTINIVLGAVIYGLLINRLDTQEQQ